MAESGIIKQKIAVEDMEDYGGKRYGTHKATSSKALAYGGKINKMADGKAVTKSKKSAKVAKRRGDGICSTR